MRGQDGSCAPYDKDKKRASSFFAGNGGLSQQFGCFCLSSQLWAVARLISVAVRFMPLLICLSFLSLVPNDVFFLVKQSHLVLLPPPIIFPVCFARHILSDGPGCDPGS